MPDGVETMPLAVAKVAMVAPARPKACQLMPSSRVSERDISTMRTRRPTCCEDASVSRLSIPVSPVWFGSDFSSRM